MIAKGLDFPNVTLVGVVNADTALHLADFRAAERTFQLLVQVAGRTGRGEQGGRVLVQTFNPDHAAIKAAVKHDYRTFADQELPMRRASAYPPFADDDSASWSVVRSRLQPASSPAILAKRCSGARARGKSRPASWGRPRPDPEAAREVPLPGASAKPRHRPACMRPSCKPPATSSRRATCSGLWTSTRLKCSN